MYPKKGHFICFIGIDGAGKTTLAKKMDLAFKREGFKCQYIYGRVFPILSRLFMYIGRTFLLRRKKQDIYTDYVSYTNQKNNLLRKGYTSKIYMWSLLIDQIVEANLKMRLKLILGKTLFCDRYIFDTVMTDITPNLQLSLDESINLISKISKIVPMPDYIFLIDLPPEVAFSRKNDVPHISYLSDRRKLYYALKDKFVNKIIVLDGMKTPEDLSEECLRMIKSFYEEDKCLEKF